MSLGTEGRTTASDSGVLGARSETGFHICNFHMLSRQKSINLKFIPKKKYFISTFHFWNETKRMWPGRAELIGVVTDTEQVESTLVTSKRV